MATPAEFFADEPLGLAVHERVCALLDPLGPYEVRVTTSQVAFRRRRGFAYLWKPGQYLRRADARIVLSVALGREHPSPRFKQVAHPAPNQWMHHLEVRSLDDVDDEVAGWLAEAAARAD